MAEEYSQNAIVVPEQEAIAVYLNVSDDVVIRQICAMENDSIVIVNKQNMQTLIIALSKLIEA